MKSSKSRKNSSDSSDEVARYRLIKVLTILLNENCSTFEWGRRASGFLRARDWPSLYAWAESTTTEVYGDAEEHYSATQIAALIRKYPFEHSEIGLPVDPEQRAYETFLSSERKCKVSNRRLREERVKRSRYMKYITYMRRWISRVIGEKPVLRDVYDLCSFSSGASVGVHGNATNLFRKLHAESWTVTPGAKVFALHALRCNHQFALSFLEERGGYACFDAEHAISQMREKCSTISFNKLSFVPKTAKTHRSIAVEPLLNSYVQKGTDSLLRRFLREWGYDLTDQTVNRRLSRKGSVDGSLATVDLSSASDSISIEFSRLVLPPDWFEFLDLIRSPSYSYRGATHRYEKFVTMGNGFCFPLQTLMFAAAVRAAIHFTGSELTHSVYGDDMIVPTSAYPLLREILAFCGFSVNKTKTFHEGPFRESCGTDWYRGQDVRPVNLDYHLLGDTKLTIFHNASLRSPRCARFFEPVRPLIREWVPKERRYMRPYDGNYNLPYRITRKLAGRNQITYATEEGIDFHDLNPEDGAFDVPLDVFMTCRWARWNSDEHRWSWKERLFRPKPDKSDDPKFDSARYLAFLSGSTGGALNLRHTAKCSNTIR